MLPPSGRNRCVSLLLSLAPLLVCGCQTMGPKMPPSMNAPSITEYQANDFKNDVASYRSLIAQKDLPGARALRNQIANRVMADIESRYSKFEMELTTQRAGFESSADAVQLGATAATAVVGATEVKDLLAASITAFQGTRLSVDKNFFREKTTESIISQMRASRDAKKAQLMKSLANREVTDYPWDAVWVDLVDLYYAGTVPSALVEIASATGTKADAAATTLKHTVAALTPRTPAQARQAIDIRSEYDKFAAAIADPAKSPEAIQLLKSILTAVGKTPADNASGADLLALLKAEMIEAKTDDDTLVKLSDALAAEKLE